jgi:hypothetical protein
VVGLLLEVVAEVVVVVLEFVLHLLLLVGEAVDAHRVDVLLQLHLAAALHQRLLQPQLLERLPQPLRRLLLHPLAHALVLHRLRLVGRRLAGGVAEDGEGLVLRSDAALARVVLLADESFELLHLGLAFDGQRLVAAEEVGHGGGDQLVEDVKLHSNIICWSSPNAPQHNA